MSVMMWLAVICLSVAMVMIAWLSAGARERAVAEPALREAEGRFRAAVATADELRRELAAWQTRSDQADGAMRLMESENAAVTARAGELERGLTEQRRLLEQSERQMKVTFESLAAEVLRKNNEGFLQLATEKLASTQQAGIAELAARELAIATLVDPMRQTLDKFDVQVHALERARGDAYVRLTEQVRALAEGQKQLQAGTDSLVGALRAPAVRGRWGEIQLRRVMEIAGMLEHCDFAEQTTLNTSDGRLRPDVIVRLPGKKCIVIDAKAPLTAYLNAREATTEERRRDCLRQHAAQVKSHVQKLGAKSYWSELEASPEIVVMFLPGDAFYSAALEHMPELLEDAMAHRVLLATPTTLIGVLQAIHVGWKQERLAENAAEISRSGRDLHERFATFSEHLAKIGGALERSVEAFNGATSSFETRVLPSVRRLEELGAGGKKELPDIHPVDKRPRSIAPRPALPLALHSTQRTAPRADLVSPSPADDADSPVHASAGAPRGA
jgi:DNA recombination protein RmuC